MATPYSQYMQLSSLPLVSPPHIYKTVAEEWFQYNSVRTTNLICHVIIIEIEIIVLSMSYKITIIIIMK